MSTRSVIEFTHGDSRLACVYRHCDGYPDGDHGAPADLVRFLLEVEANVADNRFGDPMYLAAKYVVWQAGQNSEYGYGGKKHYLNFLSLGVTEGPQAHGDLDYVHRVDCSGGGPKLPSGASLPKLFWREAGSETWHALECRVGEDASIEFDVHDETVRIPPAEVAA